MPLRIFRYILVKFNSTFVAAIAVFTALFLMDQASRQVEQLASLAQGLRDLVVSFLLLVPHLLSYTVPLAFLLAMIWTLEQMKQDGEFNAVLATGTSPLKLFLPFQAVSVAVSLVVYMMTSYLGPAAFQQYNRHIEEMTQRSFLSDMKPGTFYNGIPGTLILVGDYNPVSGMIDGLLMVRQTTSEDNQGEMIVAETGTIQQPPEGSGDIILRLENGAIHPLSTASGGYRSGSFKILTSRITTQPPDSGLKIKQLLMAASSSQIRFWLMTSKGEEKIRENISYVLELNRRLAVPIVVLLYPLIIFPPAASTGRHGKAAAFTMSLLVFLATFLFNSIGSNLAHQGLVGPAFGAWFADLLLLVIGLSIFTFYVFKQLTPGWKTMEKAQ
jgi:lipopolysaccharide export system permease protein